MGEIIHANVASRPDIYYAVPYLSNFLRTHLSVTMHPYGVDRATVSEP